MDNRLSQYTFCQTPIIATSRPVNEHLWPTEHTFTHAALFNTHTNTNKKQIVNTIVENTLRRGNHDAIILDFDVFFILKCFQPFTAI